MEEEKRKQLWKEHLQRLGESNCSSSSEENLQLDRTQKNRPVIQNQDQQLQQDTQDKHNQALQKRLLQVAAEAARRREENRKAEEAEVDRELLRRREEEAKKPKTAGGHLMKLMRKTYQRGVDYTTQNNSPYQQHRLQLKKLGQEREKTEKELLETLLEKRRKAKQPQ
ncbi:chromatin assembly factor 1 subunit FSM-like [Colossoma macropomum]|uniref:chromatin assembly factor 1 subunit FSM-like n=1 Tax=Colossoma macropomum TaxID=42526 RepID=UPI001864EC63|nr:chromatin assembly factor 1 subunit FSM-like [Colossoma macropomum]